MQIFHWQQPGIVLVTQELAASLLSCAFLCLFPVGRRGEHRLPAINMDAMLAGVWGRASQVHKVHCLVNYFRRVCESMPRGVISYERKVIFYERKVVASGMEEAGWSESRTPLCSFESLEEGVIEDAGWEYAQVDFANKFLGGGVLRMGCVQEEIRFMLSPELIAGMLFMPAMADNETIEITGSERFNNYAGYAGKFRYAGNFLDSTPRDQFGRRHTKILAMDAKPRPGESQFHQKLLLRETSKAYCAFLPTSITSKPLLPKPAMICTFSSQ
jgi:poly(ADP-ribose) glycohydrolase